MTDPVAEIRQKQDGRRAETESDAEYIADIDALLSLVNKLRAENVVLKALAGEDAVSFVSAIIDQRESLRAEVERLAAGLQEQLNAKARIIESYEAVQGDLRSQLAGADLKLRVHLKVQQEGNVLAMEELARQADEAETKLAEATAENARLINLLRERGIYYGRTK